ncbi:MAG TPA: 50S ribosomal protein L24e [Nitrososphaerales archaeon]|nr:50S ribosomal protein L24e [Nitrososphaerales archaeon]
MSYSPKRCSFCGKLIPLGTGVMYIRNDGATFWYCSSKCRKNSSVLKRDPRSLKWARQRPKPPVKASRQAQVATVAKEKA